jgi:WD40 repeat protein
MRELDVGPYGVRAVSADGGTLLGYRSRDSSVRGLRVSDGQELWTRSLPQPMEVMDGAFSRDGAAVTIVSREGEALVLDTADGHVIRTLSLEDGAGAAASYSSDGQLLAVGLAQGALRIWQLSTGELKLKEPTVPGHTGPVTKAAFSADGELIGSISGTLSPDRALKVWRTSDGALLHSSARNVQDGSRKSFAFSPDSAIVALTGGSMASQIYLLRASDGNQLRTIEPADATALAFSPDGTLLAGTPYCIGCVPQAVRVWRVADGTELPGFGDADDHGGGDVVFSPDGTLLAATSPGNRWPAPAAVSVWKVADRSLVWRVPGADPSLAPNEPESAAFSPDGALLALGSYQSARLRVYRASNGTPVGDFPATGVRGVAFSPNGALLAAAGDEGLRLWRVSDWSLFGEIPGQFTAVAFSPDGHTLLVAARDGVLRLFCSVSQPLP